MMDQQRWCYYCDHLATTIDHIIPGSTGGADNQLNYVDSCYECNNERGDMDIAEFTAMKGVNKPLPVGMSRNDYILNFFSVEYEEEIALGKISILSSNCAFCSFVFYYASYNQCDPPALYCSERHKKHASRKRAKNRSKARKRAALAVA